MNTREILQAIVDEEGRLTPTLLVHRAPDTAHPLHNRFDWDDTSAARNYRLQQAAALIRSVRIVYAEHTDGRPKDLRAFVAVKSENNPAEGVYQPVETAMTDPFTRELVLRNMRRDWLAFKRRYEHMAEFADLMRQDVAS